MEHGHVQPDPLGHSQAGVVLVVVKGGRGQVLPLPVALLPGQQFQPPRGGDVQCPCHTVGLRAHFSGCDQQAPVPVDGGDGVQQIGVPACSAVRVLQQGDAGRGEGGFRQIKPQFLRGIQQVGG